MSNGANGTAAGQRGAAAATGMQVEHQQPRGARLVAE